MRYLEWIFDAYQVPVVPNPSGPVFGPLAVMQNVFLFFLVILLNQLPPPNPSNQFHNKKMQHNQHKILTENSREKYMLISNSHLNVLPVRTDITSFA